MIQVTCPYCKELTSFVEDAEKTFCMHCGKEILKKDVVDVPKEQQKSIEAFDYLFDNFQKLLFTIDPSKGIKAFNKKKYEPFFIEYTTAHKEIYSNLQVLFSNSEHLEEDLGKIAGDFVIKAKKRIDEVSKFSRDRELTDLNCIMAFYVFPGLLTINDESSRLLAEMIVKVWKEAFPKINLGIADFDDINSGFRKRIFGIPIG